jgi:hypothetical protein
VLARLYVPAELTEHASKAHGIRQAKGVHHLLGQGERFTTTLQGLLRIAKTPQSQGRPRSTNHALILSIERGKGVMLLQIIEDHGTLQMPLGSGEFSQEGQGLAQHPVGHQEERRGLHALGQMEELLAELARCLKLCPC